MRIIKLAWGGHPNRQRRTHRRLLPRRPRPTARARPAGVLDAQAPRQQQGRGLQPRQSDQPHFTTGPVAGFLVDDIHDATAELRSAGVEILFESGVDDSGNAWVHFRAPDGNIYEFTQDPGVARPH